MSDSVRDMYVGITFQDNASRPLNTVDRLMDDIESGIAGIGRRLDDTSDEFSTVGRVGVNALNRVEDGLEDATQEATGLNREVSRSGDSLAGLKRTIMGIGGIIAGAFAVDKIKDFSVSAIELAAGTQALNSQFDQVFTGIQDTASTNLNAIAKETGVLPDRLKGSFVQMAAFAKTTGVDTASALNLTERATIAAADSAAFLDRSIEDVTDNLQSFLKGNFENDAALGISATETTRNAKANELYGKTFTKLSEAQKQLTLLAMVEDGNKLSGALGQASRESDGFENQVGNLKSAWDGLKGTLATPMLSTVTTGLGMLTQKIKGVDAEQLGIKLKNGFDTVMDVAVPTFDALKTGLGWVIDNKDTLIAATAGIATGFTAMKSIGTVTTLMGAYRASAFASTLATHGFSSALRANPIGMVVTGIGLLVTGGVMLYQNWDTIKVKAIELWQVIDNNPILSFLAGPIKGLISAGITIYQNWDTVTSNFNKFKDAVTNFKLPKWVTTVGSTISSTASTVKGWVTGGPDGSHATGLERVPYDGYVAELHKDESVLTANQSNTLRRAGILSQGSSGMPELNLEKNNASQNTSIPQNNNAESGNTTNNSGGNNFIFNITGNNAVDIAREVREIISDILDTEIQTI